MGGEVSNTAGLLKGHMETHFINFLTYIKRI